MTKKQGQCDEKKPHLVLNRNRIRQNITRMVAKANDHQCQFRPHFKTHQRHDVGRYFRQEGVDKITVSSLSMANHFIADGWTDITIAIPINPFELEACLAISPAITLGLTIDSVVMAQALVSHQGRALSVWVEVDTGHGRTGVVSADEAVAIVKTLQEAPNISFKGLLTHMGQTYRAQSKMDVKRLYKEGVDHLRQIQTAIQDQAGAACLLSIGDTPSCSVCDDLLGVDEIRPGNFVYYDLMMRTVGACGNDDIAAVLSCPVISKRPERQDVVLYGGAVHLSKEALRVGDTLRYGEIGQFDASGWGDPLPGAYLKSLSQEHGIVACDDRAVYDRIQIGDRLAVYPVHACLTADLLKGEGLVWKEISECQSKSESP